MGKIVLTYTVFENELTKKYFFVSISFFLFIEYNQKNSIQPHDGIVKSVDTNSHSH